MITIVSDVLVNRKYGVHWSSLNMETETLLIVDLSKRVLYRMLCETSNTCMHVNFDNSFAEYTIGNMI